MCDYVTVEKASLVLSAIVLLCLAKRIFNIFYHFHIGPLLNSVDFKSYGKWAMITGSTDGIGKEYARQLAAKGCNVILVSRSTEKLKRVASEIEKEFAVETKIIQVDFTDEDHIYGTIASEIIGLEIGVLVNNVGLSYPYPEYFTNLPNWHNLTSNLIKINITSVLRLTGLILPAMLKKRKGIIINISSGTAVISSPMLTVYAATKAFVIKFTEGLSEEYSKQGIILQCVTPGYVATNMSKFRKTSFFVPSAESFVKKALSTVNTDWITDGYFSHTLMHSSINFFKSIFYRFTVNKTLKTLEASRNKIIKKERKE